MQTVCTSLFFSSPAQEPVYEAAVNTSKWKMLVFGWIRIVSLGQTRGYIRVPKGDSATSLGVP